MQSAVSGQRSVTWSPEPRGVVVVAVELQAGWIEVGADGWLQETQLEPSIARS